LWAIRADGSDRRAIQLTNTQGRESTARFSPDGRWIAYTLQEQGRNDVWVQRFPSGQDRRRVSENGGADPNWRSDGQELYYLATDGMLTAVPVRDVLPSFGRPAGLFKVSPDAPFVLRSYSAQPDGQRFIVTEPVDTPDAITVVVNWAALLR
jgi:dipeptidyl aminopeptidase/acylaminoacyl peptidase